MFPLIKKFVFTITFNLSLFLILMIGIQNSNSKTKVNIIVEETIELPISFIVGISFICGSTIGSFLPRNFLLRDR